MDNKDTLNNLIKYAQKDFKGTIQNSFENFEAALEKSIKECGRSIEDQKLEAMSVLAGKKNDNSSERIAIGLAFASMALSALTGILQVSEEVITMQKAIQSILIILAVVLSIGAFVFLAFNALRRNDKIVAYYTIKLYCIERIEAQTKIADNVCSEEIDKSEKNNIPIV